MNPEKTLPKVVLLPRPLTPLAVLVYFFLTNNNDLGPHNVRFVRKSHRREPLYVSETLVDLSVDDQMLESEVLRLKNHSNLDQVVRFFSNKTLWGKTPWKEWFRNISWLKAEKAIATCIKTLTSLQSKGDISDQYPEVKVLEPSPKEIRTRGCYHFKLPELQLEKGVPGATVVNWQETRKVRQYRSCKVLVDGVFTLSNHHISILIGGDPGRGKSTLAANLVTAMEKRIRDLKITLNRVSPEAFPTIGLCSLDAATPVATGILRGDARPAGEKQPWTSQVVIDALAKQTTALERRNIVISDLPGRITAFTESLTGLGDYGIAIVDDWNEEMQRWEEFFKRARCPIVSRIKCRREDDDKYRSVVTTWHPGESISGRIFRPNRKLREEDECIDRIADILLLDILPAQILARQLAIKRW